MAEPVRLPPRSFDYEALKAALENAIAGDPLTIHARYRTAVIALLMGTTAPVPVVPMFQRTAFFVTPFFGVAA